MVHPSLSLNTLCLAPAPLDVQAAIVSGLGFGQIAPTVAQVVAYGTAQAGQLLRDAGLTVATLTHLAFAFADPDVVKPAVERLDRTIGLAAAIGARSITMTMGGGRHPDMGRCRQTLRRSDCAVRDASAGGGRRSGDQADLAALCQRVRRLSDTLTVARQSGITVGIDLFACWSDADIASATPAAGPVAALVQVSDYVAGDRSLPCRAVPDDRIVPLTRLLPAIIAAGCTGPFDLEIIGPRLEGEGRSIGLARAADYVGRILEEAGLLS